jgi:TPR repeat protein
MPQQISKIVKKTPQVLVFVLGAAILGACSDTGGKPADAAKSEASKQSGADAANPAQSTDVTKLKTELAGASSVDIMKKSEELWAAKDYASAVSLAEMARDKDGNRNAVYRLATAYYAGQGVEKNLDKAWELFNQPELGDVKEIHYYVGLIQADKSFSGHDLAKAKASLQKAKDLGVAGAEAKLQSLN